MGHDDISRVEPGEEYPVITHEADPEERVRPEVRRFMPPGLNEGDMNAADQELAASPVVGAGSPDAAPALPANSWEGYTTEARTDGLSQKATFAALAPVVVAVVLMLLDLTGVVPMEDGIWLALIGGGALAGGGAVAGKPGNVTYMRKDGGDLR